MSFKRDGEPDIIHNRRKMEAAITNTRGRFRIDRRDVRQWESMGKIGLLPNDIYGTMNMNWTGRRACLHHKIRTIEWRKL